MATEAIPSPAETAQQHNAPQNPPVCWPDVLTLEEAASFLRVRVSAMERLAQEKIVPARRVEMQWLFLRRALEEWLLGKGDRKDSRTALLEQVGAFANDETLPELLKAIYAARGRPEVEPPAE